ncbi:MAG: hypothetical protein PHI35_03945, partial [Victivallaceae bacterium]|nr:hypothetical protein [Victivallaceae bacterium]
MNGKLYDITVRSRLGDYPVGVWNSPEFLAELAKLPHLALAVDRKVYELYKETWRNYFGDADIFLIDAVEENKNLEYAGKLYEWLIGSFSAKRNLNFVSAGGGIVQDVSGFVASTLYRGIAWRFIPTTLLAQCDSCIGGKTSLNFGNHKNLLGTFYPPREIIIWPD